MSSDDVVRFLRDRYDEEAQVAHDCSGEKWRVHPQNWVSCLPLNRVALVVHDGDRAHIVRQDPAHTLRRIEAQRRVLTNCELLLKLPYPESKDDAKDYRDGILHGVLMPLALPYADHPAYQETWAVAAPSVSPRP